MVSPPVADGKVRNSEWSSAAQMAGLYAQLGYLQGTGIRVRDDARVWVGYTAGAVHFACRFEQPPHALQPLARQRDRSIEKDIWRDDTVELLLVPEGEEPRYHFAVNANGVGGEGLLKSSTDMSWDCDWQRGASLTETGWEVELSIPFASLQRRAPSPGEAWRFVVIRGRKTPEKELGTSAFLNAWGKTGELGYLRFASGDEPAVQVTQVGPLSPQDNGFALEVSSAEGAAIRVEAALYRQTGQATVVQQTLDPTEDILLPKVEPVSFFRLSDAEGLAQAMTRYERLRAWTEEIVVPAGQRGTLTLEHPSGVGSFLLTYLVHDSKTRELLAGRAVPFEHRAPLEVQIEPWVLVAKALNIVLDCRDAGRLPDEVRAQVTLTDQTTNAVVAQGEVPVDGTLRRAELRFGSADLLGRRLAARTQLRSGVGAVIAETSTPVMVPPQPKWLGNGIGLTNEVMPPWTPIEVGGPRSRAQTARERPGPGVQPLTVARVVLREYQLGASGLPAQILSRGKELLWAPVELTLAGRAPKWTRRLVSQKPTAVIWEAKASTRALRMVLKTTLEYDGMIRYDLTLDPGRAEAQLRELQLHIPYRADRNIERVPFVSEAFVPLVQLGDFETGLCWFAEWWKGWQIGAKPPVEMQPNGDAIAWRVRFVGSEGKVIREPLTLTWGLQALPVKALDLGYQYDGRRVHGAGGGDNPDPRAPMALSADLTECCLRYPTKRNLPVDVGSMTLHLLPGATLNVPEIRVLELRQDDQALSLWWERKWAKDDRWPFKQALTLRRGEKVVARVHPITRRLDTPWVPVALSWKRDDKNTRITIVSTDSAGQVLSDEADVPFWLWRNVCAAEEMILGGAQTIGIDNLRIGTRAYGPGRLLSMATRPARPGAAYTLVDPIDDLRFYRARYMTRPLRIANGRGGIAGANAVGSFVQEIEGQYGKGVLLPAGKQRTQVDWLRSFGADIAFTNQETLGAMAGYYDPNFVPDPVLRERFDEIRQQGMGIEFYCGMAFDPKWDHLVGPYMPELVHKPVKQVYTGQVPCLHSPARDYYLWGWQRTVDYYGVQSIHMDNTLNCRDECSNEAHGCGWRDEDGILHGRWPIFGTRETAKRFYWLFHVHRRELDGQSGYIGLHAAGSEYPMVSGFTDFRKHGEGAGFSDSGFAASPMLPEEFTHGVTTHRYGVPVEILTKGDRMPYGPNYLYLYCLLYDMSLRASIQHFHPSWWHIRPDDPQPDEAKPLGPYDPYFARVGVSNVALPLPLWWMLQDEFGTRAAEFHPFWSNGDCVALNDDKLRASFWLHRGRSALFVVANFGAKQTEATLTLDLATLGLDAKELRAYDAFTDDDYALDGDTITVGIPGAQYRLVRVDAP
jgi:hypothetical protein